MKLMNVQKKFGRKFIVRTVGVTAVLAGSVAMAAGDPTSDSISTLQTAIIALIGLGAAAGFAVLAASLTPDIGMAITKKWIKKGAK